MAVTLFGDKVETETTIFGDAVELIDEDAVQTFPDPAAEDKRINETLDMSEQLGLPIIDVNGNYKQLTEKPEKVIAGTITPSGISGEPDVLRAAPERTKWQKFKKFFVGERPPLPPNPDRIEKLTRAFDIGVTGPMRAFLKFSKGMTWNAPDLMWAAIKRITPEDMWTDEVRKMTLDEAMDWAGGYNPSGFQKSVGEIAEFVGRLKTVAPIAQKLKIIGDTPKSITALGKAFETAKLFGTAAVVEQVTKGASDIIEPTEAEYGFEGPKAVLRDMALGAIFSLVSSGVKGLWSKLTPTEYQRALKLLGLKEGASQEEITKAANSLARQYHPDKAKGFIEDFKQVIKARDILRQGEVKDIVYRGQKVVLKPKLLPGEVAPTVAIVAPEKPVAPITAPKAPITPVTPAIERPAEKVMASFNKYKKAMPNATEQEIVEALIEDGLRPPKDMLKKYEDLPSVQKILEQDEIDKVVKRAAKLEAAEVAPLPDVEEIIKLTPESPELKKVIEDISNQIDIAFEQDDLDAMQEIVPLTWELPKTSEADALRKRAQILDGEMLARARKRLVEKIPPRPLVNPKASALQRDKQLKKQQAWDKKYGKLKAEPLKPKPRTAGFLGIPVEFPEPEVAREVAEKIYQDYINRFASIENAVKKAKKFGLDVLPGEDPALRARSYLGLGRKVEVMLEKNTYRTTKQGNIEVTGEGLKPILDSYENSTKTLEPSRKKREKDFNDYLIATRTVEDLQRGAFEGAEKNIASKKQVAEAQGRLDELAKDYGEKGVAIFEEHAQRLYEYQKRVLHLLVDAGNLSQKQFDQITELNQHYIPFDRVMDEQIIGGVPVSKKRFTRARAPIGKIRGSELEVEDTMESVIKNTYRIVDAADRNAVAANLAKLAGTLPDKISPVRVKIIPIRIDPKEILTVSREFRSQSSKIMDEVRTITEEGGVNLTGPAKKLEKVVKDALTHRGFSEGEANSFVIQIKKGEPSTGEGVTKETLRQTIRETQRIIITQEPVESIIFRPSQFAPKGKVIEYFVKGRRKYVELSGNLFDAMTGLNETSASVMIRVLAKPAHWLRVGATITPEFITKNPIRDQWTALMQTSFGFTPFVDPAGAIADIIKKSDVYYEWLASGGAYSGFVELNRPALEKTVKELRKPIIKKLLGKLNIISDAQDLSQLMEMATRLGAFKAAKRKGMPSIAAGFESREASIDFQRRGGKMADVNRVIAFFGAGIQGVDKTVRTVINHPYQTAAKGIIAITIPSLLLYLRNRKEEDYAELAQWKKDLFWNFKIGDNWWRVPKPFLFGQLFGSIPERFFEFADTKDVKAFDDLSKTVIDSLTPVSGDPEAGLLFTALKPIIENIANWNFFLQRPIVPRAKEELLPPEQFTRYTSETAKQLGRWLNYSPAKIENLVRGYFGGTGRYALQGTDVLVNGIRRAAGEKVKPKRPKQLADIPLVKAFVHRPPTGSVSRSVNDFYESADVILKGWNTIRLMQKEGRRTEMQGLLATNPEIRLHSSMTKFRTRMSDLTKRSDIILKQDIPVETKKQRIRKIDDQKLALAKKANDMIRKAQEKAQ